MLLLLVTSRFVQLLHVAHDFAQIVIEEFCPNLIAEVILIIACHKVPGHVSHKHFIHVGLDKLAKNLTKHVGACTLSFELILEIQ